MLQEVFPETADMAGQPAIGFMSFEYQDFTMSGNVGYIFAQHPNATEEQYRTGRKIFLDQVNTLLIDINRKGVPT